MKAETPEVILVTGAGSGMGYETSLHLARSGYRVYGSVFSESEREALTRGAAERGVTLDVVRMDVTQPDQVKTIVAGIPRIDGLVHFAGSGLRGCVEDLSIDEVRKIFEVNFYGALNCIQAVLPAMRRQRSGRMIITTSAGGRIGSIGIGGYVATKFALEGLVECLAQEVAMFNIKVSLLEPGLIQTPHFTIHRHRAKKALEPASPYYKWFLQHEKMVDDILARNSFTTADVSRIVHGILTDKNPKFRHIVGTKAKVLIGMRRYIPGEIFQRIHWRVVRRVVTRPKVQATTLSGLEHTPGHEATTRSDAGKTSAVPGAVQSPR